MKDKKLISISLVLLACIAWVISYHFMVAYHAHYAYSITVASALSVFIFVIYWNASGWEAIMLLPFFLFSISNDLDTVACDPGVCELNDYLAWVLIALIIAARIHNHVRTNSS